MRYSSFASGASAPLISVLKRRLIARQRVTAVFHAPGISDSTFSRARTSSPRFVSCVEVADNADGHRPFRADIHACTADGSRPNWVGSEPTSFSDTSLL